MVWDNAQVIHQNITSPVFQKGTWNSFWYMRVLVPRLAIATKVAIAKRYKFIVKPKYNETRFCVWNPNSLSLFSWQLLQVVGRWCNNHWNHAAQFFHVQSRVFSSSWLRLHRRCWSWSSRALAPILLSAPRKMSASHFRWVYSVHKICNVLQGKACPRNTPKFVRSHFLHERTRAMGAVRVLVNSHHIDMNTDFVRPPCRYCCY